MKATAALGNGLVVSLCVSLAYADEQQIRAAGQVAGLFVQTCVQFPGDTTKVQGWLEQRSVPKLSPQMLAALLRNRPGIGYDTSNTSGRFALTLESGGLCTAYAERADSAELFRILERLLNDAHLEFKQMSDRTDPREPALRHRGFVLTKEGRPYTMVISTSAAEGKIQAFLSLAPHSPSDPF